MSCLSGSSKAKKMRTNSGSEQPEPPSTQPQPSTPQTPAEFIPTDPKTLTMALENAKQLVSCLTRLSTFNSLLYFVCSCSLRMGVIQVLMTVLLAVHLIYIIQVQALLLVAVPLTMLLKFRSHLRKTKLTILVEAVKF